MNWLFRAGLLLGAAGGAVVATIKILDAHLEKEVKIRAAKIAPTSWYLAGEKLSHDEMLEQENILKSDPFDVKARSLIIGFLQFKTDETSVESLVAHKLWVIENLPRNNLVKFCEFHCIPDSEALYEKAKKLWLQHVDNYPDDKVILDNAADFVMLEDKDLAEKLLLKAKSLEPRNPYWSERIAHLYSLEASGEDSIEYAVKALKEQERAYSIAKSHTSKLHCLYDLPELAYEAAQYDKAQCYATNLLEQFVNDKSDQSDCKHIAHTVLGRLALRNNDIETAKNHLLESSDVKGSPVLCSFGPRFILATELLEKGEQEIVINYVQACALFWPHAKEKLSEWIQEIKTGSAPEKWWR